MSLSVGQGVYLKLNFADGGICKRKRTFLVIDSSDDEYLLLNTSSSVGKEHKLAFKSNESLKVFKPPFVKPSFVKLDALYKISKDIKFQKAKLAKGNTLDEEELKRIQDLWNSYITKSHFNEVKYSGTEILILNPEIAM